MKKTIIVGSILIIILVLIGVFIFLNKDEKLENLTNVESINTDAVEEDKINDNIKTFWISTPQGDLVEDKRNPNDVCLNLQKGRGFENCELLEMKESRDDKECATGKSIAGCFACKISCLGSKGRHSMKGWEVYSWKKENSLYFSLVQGTNSRKQCYLVKSNSQKLSLNELKNKLSQLAENESVYFPNKNSLSGECDVLDELPEEIESEIKNYSDELKLKFIYF